MTIFRSGNCSLRLRKDHKFDLSLSVRQSLQVRLTIVNHCKSDTTDPVLLNYADSVARFITSPNIDDFIYLSDFAYDADGEKNFFIFQQLQAIFKKDASIDLGIDRRETALQTFLLSEEVCARTNESLIYGYCECNNSRDVLISKMYRKIQQIIGFEPPLPSDLQLSFGPGATVGIKHDTSVRHKLGRPLTATRAALQFFISECLYVTPKSSILSREERLIRHWPGFARPVIVPGGEYGSVPKNSKTDRSIMTEPTLNMSLQKAHGDFIRKRLKQRAGINLNDQSRNKDLARKGSLDNSLATIDLKMASDTIARDLVVRLLTHTWFSRLNAIRSPSAKIEDEYIELEKFSSQGNGFNFELESLIFWAACHTVCTKPEYLSVYGDDIICHSSDYDRVVGALEMLGFIINGDKSFSDGPFRESCGGDYYNGIDVRPVYIKEEMSIKEIFRIHNFFFRTGRLLGICKELINLLPKRFRLFGPEFCGDGHLWAAPDYLVYKYVKHLYTYSCNYTTFVAKPRTLKIRKFSFYKGSTADYGACLFLRANSEPSSSPPPRPIYPCHIHVLLRDPSDWMAISGSESKVEKLLITERGYTSYGKKNIRRFS